VRRIALFVVLLSLLAVGGFGAVHLLAGEREHEDVAARCAGGERDGDADAEAAKEADGDRDREREREEGEREGAARAGGNGLFSGPAENPEAECAAPGRHPESFADLAKANSTRISRTVAPGTEVKTGAYAAAVAQRDRLAGAGSASGGGATWQPYGDTPLRTDQTDYDQTAGSTAASTPRRPTAASGSATATTRRGSRSPTGCPARSSPAWPGRRPAAGAARCWC
jgi:hypothetical protein